MNAPAAPAPVGPSAPPVITIDGPTASGKGTIAQRVAQALGWNYLDSGALYRVTALAALQHDIDLHDEVLLARLAGSLPLRFDGQRILLAGRDVAEAIRAEGVGNAASRIAVLAGVRSELLVLQRRFRRPPGLVADGRDMGTIVFPQADLKVFLTASVESRAERRYKQLIEKGFSANLPTLLRDLAERDTRDARRAIAPLRPAEGALLLDSTGMSVEQTVDRVLDAYRGLRDG